MNPADVILTVALVTVGAVLVAVAIDWSEWRRRQARCRAEERRLREHSAMDVPAGHRRLP